MKKVGLSFLALAIFSVFLYSCKTETITAPENTNTIKIGALLSYSTGEWTTLGKTSKSAIGIAEVRANSHFASINSNNRVSVVYSDTYMNADSALSQIRRMYASGIRIVIGPQSSSEVAKIKPFADSSGMVVISQGSTAGSLSIPGDNIFRFCPVDSMEAKASVALMNYDTIKYMIPVYRTDVGNTGLFNSVSGYFASSVSGGTIAAAISYDASTTNFAPIVALIKARILATPPGVRAGVYLAAFDENVQIFLAASSDPVLSSVKWYGSDGVVQSTALTGNTTASSFAAAVKYDCPIFGLDASTAALRAPLTTQIISETGIQPDAFTFAAYDAFYVAALTVNDVPTFSTSAYKTAFISRANTYSGMTGSTTLNASGDRATANFDFWAVRPNGATYQWKIVAKYNSATGVIEITE